MRTVSQVASVSIPLKKTQRYHAIVDSAAESVAIGADTSRVSSMGGGFDGFPASGARVYDRGVGSGGGALSGSDSHNDSPLVFDAIRWLGCGMHDPVEYRSDLHGDCWTSKN